MTRLRKVYKRKHQMSSVNVLADEFNNCYFPRIWKSISYYNPFGTNATEVTEEIREEHDEL